MKKIIFSGAIALMALTSCSNDNEPMMNPTSNNSLRVYGMIQELKSRAGDTSFDANDAIGITVGDNVNVQYITTDGTAFTSATPISITSEENITLSAYYPYDANLASDGIINFNVTEAGVHDYLFAQTNVSTTNATANLQFAHKMSKVAITLDTDEGLLEDGAKVTLSVNAIVDGTFNTTTGAVVAGSTKGSVSAGQVLASGGSGSFILPPSTSATDIKVSVATSDAIYSGTINPTLQAGHQHNYKLTLKSDGAAGIALEISIPASDPITEWVSETEIEGDLEKEIPSLPVNETLEVGDFLLSNGATLDKAFDLSTISSYQEGKDGVNVSAVVYYVGNPGDATLTAAMTTVNGLALALNNSGVAARLASAKYNYATWFSTGENGASFVGSNLNLTSASTNMLGYNNTQILKAANVDASNCCDDLISLLDAETAINGASEWYLPSYAELKVVQDNYSTINASIVNAGGSLAQYPDYTYSKAEGKAADSSYTANTNENFYWTSDLRGDSYSWVCPMAELTSTFTDEQFFVGRNSNGTKGFFRFAVAF